MQCGIWKILAPQQPDCSETVANMSGTETNDIIFQIIIPVIIGDNKRSLQSRVIF